MVGVYAVFAGAKNGRASRRLLPAIDHHLSFAKVTFRPGGDIIYLLFMADILSFIHIAYSTGARCNIACFVVLSAMDGVYAVFAGAKNGLVRGDCSRQSITI